MNLEIEIEQDHFRGGDIVQGTVVVDVDKETKCDGLTLSRCWRTKGQAPSDHGGHFNQILFRGVWQRGQHRYPFQVFIPNGPFSYDGDRFRLDWYLSARADLAWAIDKSDELILTVTPGTGAPPPQPSRTPSLFTPSTKKTLGYTIATVVTLPMPLTTFFFVFFFLQSFPLAVAAGLLGLIPPIAFGYLALKPRVARRKLGDVDVRVRRTTLSLGEEAVVSVSVTPKVPLQKIRATLLLKEYSIRTQGGERTTSSHVVYQRELDFGPLAFAPQMPLHLSRTLPIPAEQPPSFHGRSNRLCWGVLVGIEIAKWPDWEEEIDLVVLPSTSGPLT